MIEDNETQYLFTKDMMLGNFNMKFDDNTLSNDNVDEDEFLKDVT